MYLNGNSMHTHPTSKGKPGILPSPLEPAWLVMSLLDAFAPTVP